MHHKKKELKKKIMHTTRKILYVFCFTFLLIFCFNSIQKTSKYTVEAGIFEVEYKFEEDNFCKNIFSSQIFDAAQIWHSNRKKIYNASHHLDLQNIFQTKPAKNGLFTEEGHFMHKIFFKLLTVGSFSSSRCFLAISNSHLFS